MFVIVFGAGFVGKPLCRLLENEGHHVVAVARHEAEGFSACDITDCKALEGLREEVGQADAMVHCASSGSGSADRLARYRAVYLEGCRNIIRVFSPARLVFASSSSVYGQTDGSIVDESSALNSTSKSHPEGLLNSSGLVGKNLMFHVYAGASGFFDDLDTPTYRGPLACIIMSQEFYETDPSRDFKRGYTFQMGRGQGPAPTATGGVSWGKNHHAEFAERFGKNLGLGVIGDDLPEEKNRVELYRKLADRYGIPAPKIIYRVGNNSKHLLAHGVNSARTVLESAGASRIISSQLSTNAGWHLMGTARMGEDPTLSVVNQYGQGHDADNVFIVDGSVFVTGAAVNPTPTIQALALRTADYIRHERSDLKS